MVNAKKLARKYIALLQEERPAYRSKVFGIGFPKTGTTTLGHCLRHLGYKHTTFDPDLTVQVRRGFVETAIKKARRYEAFEDWPWFLIYKDLFEAFPNAKFVLTVRTDARTYVDSLWRFRDRKGVYSGSFEEPWWWREAIGYEPSYWNPEKMMDDYTAHNDQVINFFRDYPDRFATMCWEHGDDWQRLCHFIGRPVPQTPFPHLNKTQNTANPRVG